MDYRDKKEIGEVVSNTIQRYLLKSLVGDISSPMFGTKNICLLRDIEDEPDENIEGVVRHKLSHIEEDDISFIVSLLKTYKKESDGTVINILAYNTVLRDYLMCVERRLIKRQIEVVKNLSNDPEIVKLKESIDELTKQLVTKSAEKGVELSISPTTTIGGIDVPHINIFGGFD